METTITIDYNDKAFLAALLSSYIQDENVQSAHLANLLNKLRGQEGC
jgi:hypothetical protein